jgi:hypothetical protein
MVVSVVEPGVVVKDVDPPEVILDAREQLPDLILVGQVGLARVCADVVLANVDSDDRRALAGQPVGHCAGQGLAAPVMTQTLFFSRTGLLAWADIRSVLQ